MSEARLCVTCRGLLLPGDESCGAEIHAKTMDYTNEGDVALLRESLPPALLTPPPARA